MKKSKTSPVTQVKMYSVVTSENLKRTGKYTNTLTTTATWQTPERYENFWPTPKNFWQPKNFRLLQQLGGAAAPPSTPSNTPM